MARTNRVVRVIFHAPVSWAVGSPCLTHVGRRAFDADHRVLGRGEAAAVIAD